MVDDETLKTQLEKLLPWLRAKILNLDDYVPREEFNSLQSEVDGVTRETFSLLSKCDALKNQLEAVRNAKNFLERQLDIVSNEKISLEAERDDLSNRLSTAEKSLQAATAHLEKISAERDYFRANYADLDSAYKNYLSLNANLRYQLAGIFGDAETVQGFLIGAATEQHLSDFWDYLRYSLNDNRLSDNEAKILTELFDFCFDTLNRSSREPIYSRLQTQCGARFDNRTMTRTSDSRQLGRVQKILLTGYVDRVGNVVRPSLVFIAE